MRIPDSVLAQITERLDMAELVSAYVRLEKKGGRYWGLCPFHTEKTPSFTVTPDKAVFYCFGCHKGGSLFTFIMEVEKLSFVEAVRFLAQKAGVEIQLEEEPDSGRKDAYLELYRRVAGSLHYLLLNHAEAAAARAYLAGRAIRQEVLERFLVGYAPPGRDWLYAFLREKNFSPEFLRSSGLFFVPRTGEPVALFRDRIVFPIGNSRGELVGFGGRSLGGERGPKYLNTPETPFFRKGELLFGEPGVFQNIRREGRFLLVEGYMDVLAASQAGLSYCLAPLGTALTADQVRLLKRFAQSGLLGFDADEAGLRAAERAILLCEQAGVDVEVVRMQGGKDPAELLEKQGPEALHKALKYPINSFRFFIETARARYDPGTPEGKKAIIASLSPYLAVVDSQVKRDGYFRLLAEELEVEFDSVRADFLRGASRTAPARRGAAPAAGSGLTSDYFFMLTVAVHRDSFTQVRNVVGPEDLEDARARKLYIALEECFRAGESTEQALLARIEDPALRTEVLSRTASGEFAADPGRLIQDGLASVRRRSLERRRNALSAQLVSAAGREPGRLKDLLAEKMHIDEELERLKVGGDERSGE
jgi:DNA primase